MRELGIENFYIEVLEECSVDKLNEREQFYITLFDSWKNGYNNGNSQNFLDGENNCNAKMTEKEIEDIRLRQSKMIEDRNTIYQDYKDKITWSNFAYICKYLTWPDILKEYNTPEIMKWHEERVGNNKIKLSLFDIENIIKMRYEQKKTNIEIGKIYNKHPKTISRIFSGVYYKKEVEFLKETKPELFSN